MKAPEPTQQQQSPALFENAPRELARSRGGKARSLSGDVRPLPSRPGNVKSIRTMEVRYVNALRNLPAPGWGLGCHGALLGIANLGVMAGMFPEDIHRDIRSWLPPGGRQVSDKEITDAINKALFDHRDGHSHTQRSRPAPFIKDWETALKRIIEQGTISNDADLWEASPVGLKCLPEETPALFLSTLFNPDDLVWIGERNQPGILGETIRTTSEWIEFFQGGGKAGSHIIINPLTGVPAPLKSGNGETMRGDGNVKAYKYCLIEFDILSREEQIRFWSAVKLPIMALIDSGGKSIHAWVQIQKLVTVNTQEGWREEVKFKLYDRLLTPLGVDAACSNPARLSRLPGHYRVDKCSMQRLLWLSSEGRPVC